MILIQDYNWILRDGRLSIGVKRNDMFINCKNASMPQHESGDIKRVRKLQKTLMSLVQIEYHGKKGNARQSGRKTAGVDGIAVPISTF